MAGRWFLTRNLPAMARASTWAPLEREKQMVEQLQRITAHLVKELDATTHGNEVTHDVWDGDSNPHLTSSGACVLVKRGTCQLYVRFETPESYNFELESPRTHHRYTVGETLQALAYLSKLIDKIETILDEVDMHPTSLDASQGMLL